MLQRAGAAFRRQGKRRTIIFAAAVMTLLLALCPIRIGIVVGESMAPPYHTGSVYLVTGARRHPQIHSGDIIIFEHAGETYVKRVLAGPGERINLAFWPGDHHSEVLDVWQLHYIRKAIRTGFWAQSLRIESGRVPAGHYFVAGDNAGASLDSREFGPIPADAIRGKVLFAPELQEEPAVLRRYAGPWGNPTLPAPPPGART